MPVLDDVAAFAVLAGLLAGGIGVGLLVWLRGVVGRALPPDGDRNT